MNKAKAPPRMLAHEHIKYAQDPLVDSQTEQHKARQNIPGKKGQTKVFLYNGEEKKQDQAIV